MSIDCNPLASEVASAGDGSGAVSLPIGAGAGTGAITGGSALAPGSVAGAVNSSSSSTGGQAHNPGEKAVVKLDWGVRGTIFLAMDGLQRATGATQRAYSPTYVCNATALDGPEVARIELMISTDWDAAPSAIVIGEFQEVNIWKFTLPGALVNTPGAYRAQWVARAANGEALWLRHAWIEWRSNNLAVAGAFPICIDDMRQFMLDQTPAQNSAMNALEFSDYQILESLAQTIDYFNSQTPNVGFKWSPTYFPWREPLQKGTASKLLKAAARGKMRNLIDLNAGGLQVNLEKRWKEYDIVADALWIEYKQFTLSKRNQIDMEQSYGWSGSFSS